MNVSGFFRQHPHLRRKRPYEAVCLILALVLLLLLATRALSQELPGPVFTPEAEPFRPGLLSTGRLDYQIVGVKTITYDRGRRTATASINANVVTIVAENHPGALFVVIRGTGGEVRADNWHRPSGSALTWQTLTPLSRPLADQPASLRIELPAAVDSSPNLTIWIFSPADIAAAGSIGLALQRPLTLGGT